MCKTGRSAKEEVIQIPNDKLNKAYTQFPYTLDEPDGSKRSLLLKRDGYSFPITDIHNVLPDGTQFLKKTVKVPLSTSELIEKLQDKIHKITFTDSEKQQAQADLDVINYYRISAFRKNINQDSTTYTDLIALYQFDRFLRNSISRLVPTIEISLKTSLARFIAMNYKNSDLEYSGGLAYLNLSIYKQSSGKQLEVKRMLSQFSEEMTRLINKDSMIKHHVTNYGGQIPIWVLFEEITLGEFSKFVSLLPSELVQQWCEDLFVAPFRIFSNTHKDVKGWISTIQVLRNTAAHGSKIYGQFLTYNPRISDENLSRLDLENMGRITPENLRHTLFAGLLTLKIFYSRLRLADKKEWNTFLDKLSNKIKKNSIVDISKIGMPQNWFEVLQIDLEEQ
ncbi:Abi family protein [Levilactobacillus sp. HBUAS70063]|uniref:Abi family protein n=1 Tax=Levilactobacillus sp. HBUAS70063 TaxID=3109359 RepID=UPI003132D07E